MLKEQAIPEKLVHVNLPVTALSLRALSRLAQHRPTARARLVWARLPPLWVASPVAKELTEQMVPRRLEAEDLVHGAPRAVERTLDPRVAWAERLACEVEVLLRGRGCELLVQGFELSRPEERKGACEGGEGSVGAQGAKR